MDIFLFAVYALTGREDVECAGYGTTYSLAERGAWLLERAEDILLPVSELARAIDGLRVPITASTIRSWVHRRRLLPRARASSGADLYRVSDVRDLVRASAQRREPFQSRVDKLQRSFLLS